MAEGGIMENITNDALWRGSSEGNTELEALRWQVYEAYTRHCAEHHNADFEVCSDPQCTAAVVVEANYPQVSA
jgi:hypothetical protein